jgi:hypothetical protein
MVLWLFGENIRRWLGLKEDEKMTFGKILKRIFVREDIARKTFVREKGKILLQIKPVEEQPKVVVEKENTSTEDEIRKILEGLE